MGKCADLETDLVRLAALTLKSPRPSAVVVMIAGKTTEKMMGLMIGLMLRMTMNGLMATMPGGASLALTGSCRFIQSVCPRRAYHGVVRLKDKFSLGGASKQTSQGIVLANEHSNELERHR